MGGGCNGALWLIPLNEMPVSVMRSVKSELLTPWKVQASCWEYLRMFHDDMRERLLEMKKETLKNYQMSHSATVTQWLAVRAKSSPSWITCIWSTNTGNAKMLMLTFTRGWEVGLVKQWRVWKVNRGISHSRCASQLHTPAKHKYISRQWHESWWSLQWCSGEI